MYYINNLAPYFYPTTFTMYKLHYFFVKYVFIYLF